jgi:hypothetical protein
VEATGCWGSSCGCVIDKLYGFWLSMCIRDVVESGDGVELMGGELGKGEGERELGIQDERSKIKPEDLRCSLNASRRQRCGGNSKICRWLQKKPGLSVRRDSCEDVAAVRAEIYLLPTGLITLLNLSNQMIIPNYPDPEPIESSLLTGARVINKSRAKSIPS